MTNWQLTINFLSDVREGAGFGESFKGRRIYILIVPSYRTLDLESGTIIHCTKKHFHSPEPGTIWEPSSRPCYQRRWSRSQHSWAPSSSLPVYCVFQWMCMNTSFIIYSPPFSTCPKSNSWSKGTRVHNIIRFIHQTIAKPCCAKKTGPPPPPPPSSHRRRVSSAPGMQSRPKKECCEECLKNGTSSGNGCIYGLTDLTMVITSDVHLE